MTMHEKKGDNVNPEPKASRLGGEGGGWLMQLPPNIFNGIAGLLDSRSLLQLANSHDQLQKMVRESEKHWKDVFVSGHTFCIDYECYERPDADLLLDNAKIDNYQENEPVSGARGFMELPTELITIVLEPLDFGSLLQVEGCHEKLKAIGHRVPIEFVGQGPTFDISADGVEPTWKIEGNPVLTFVSTWISHPGVKAAMNAFFSMMGLALKPDPKAKNPVEEPVPPIEFVMSNSLLHGRHVQTVHYMGTCPRQPESAQPKVKPKFTCENFFFVANSSDWYLDKEILRALNPENVWSERFMDWMLEADFPKGSLSLSVWPAVLAKVKQLPVSRLSFETSAWGNDIFGVISGYIDEWMAGRRNIETIWIERIEPDDYDEDNDGEGIELLKSLSEKYSSLKPEKNDIVRGQLWRKGGKMLAIRVNAHNFVMQTPGGSNRFLSYHSVYHKVPKF